MTKYNNKKTEWTESEIKHLIQLRMDRKSIPACALILNRSKCSVQNKCTRLFRKNLLPKVRSLKIKNPEERFWSKVEIKSEDQCWNWSSKSMYSSGYGCARFDFGSGIKLHGAHRISFYLSNGFIPEKLEILHSCDNKKCCNPKHLSAGTKNQNIKEAWARGLVSKRPPTIKSFKISTEQVIEIRKRHAAGESRKKLAAEFNFSKSGMDHLISRRHWKHVE